MPVAGITVETSDLEEVVVVTPSDVLDARTQIQTSLSIAGTRHTLVHTTATNHMSLSTNGTPVTPVSTTATPGRSIPTTPCATVLSETPATRESSFIFRLT